MNRMLLQSRLLALVLSLAVPAAMPACAQEHSPSANASKMDWWRHDRFGMFIHWGLYAIPAGHYEGKPVQGIGEWIMSKGMIPRDQYEAFATQFNPTHFDADAWVRMAKYAGMKYIVITSKHHDGFALFDGVGDYDVVDATPYERDILRSLREACDRHGLKFCTYYSIMDWHHPSQAPAKIIDERPVWNPTKMIEGKKSDYVDYMKQHLEVLVKDLGTHVLWFDGEWPDWWSDQDGRDLYDWMLEMNPNLIVNNRIGAGRKGMAGFSKDGSFAGDFGTPEQEIPATGVESDWESCMTMNDTWGFRKDDHHWKSTETLVRNLIDIASKGGNYLLNIGPKADGTFPEASVERLRGIGKWMSVNGEAIHGTQAALFLPTWGRVTRKDGTVYLHVFDWPGDGILRIPALANRLRRVSLLAAPEVDLATDVADDQWTIHVPPQGLDSIATVITIDVEGTPRLAQ